ncbi:MAG: adenylate/guanylate cyclase domain-containing protein [Proteobacteria bacterium]|nr:adenylate/guanylate cyclase domain-containing protein [Pseudomonadota bacterium]
MSARLRLVSGLVLFAFVACHLANHALGLWSLAWMEAGREVFLALWRNWPMTVLFYGAMFVHVVCALQVLARRRSLRMSWRDGLQVLLGLAMPLLVAAHVAGTRLAHELWNIEDGYAYVLYAIWIDDIDEGVIQTLLLLAIWLHGVIGLANWLRLKPWYRRAQPWLLSGAVLLPVLALAGIAQGTRQVAALAGQPGWLAQLGERSGLAPVADQVIAMVNGARPVVAAVMVLLLGGLLAWRLARDAAARRRRPPRLSYPDGRTVEIYPGMTVLEASQKAGIPHASICGGRGRCSTCRIRTGPGGEHLSEPSVQEQRVLDRIAAPPSVRLACQLRPTADLAVAPLLQPHEAAGRVLAPISPSGGEERDIAVLFADLRGFTALAEDRLPYDTVFVLNRYFAAMGGAIEAAGGQIDKFVGDGVMALFGLRGTSSDGCRQAVDAARRMGTALAVLNDSLKAELPAPLRIGIGIHAGPAVVGEMGYGPALHVTAIGDVVNAASRLESATKELGVELVISGETLQRAGLDATAMQRHALDVRGRRNKVDAWAGAIADLPGTTIDATPGSPTVAS